MVGQTGLERLLDEFLRGKDGGERIEVDAMGRQIRLVQSTEPHPGAQVITTVDRRVQEVAEKAMEGKAGAIVVMDPRNGDVLAMVSTPSFEIDRFTGTIDRNAWLRVIQDPNFPLPRDRKSTRLNSSHLVISYAVFCLKKKKKINDQYEDTIQYYKN